jgi:hypothetical protein
MVKAMEIAEYYDLFHRAQVNLVAFKRVNDCDMELKAMVELAVQEALEKERQKNEH